MRRTHYDFFLLANFFMLASGLVAEVVCQEHTNAVTAAVLPGEDMAADLSTSVRVWLYAENVQEKSWDFPPGKPYLEYTQPMFFFSGVPKHYVPPGIIGTQPNPFLLRAQSQVQLPAGRYEFLLRAKNAARLFVNGQLVAETNWMSRNASGHEPVAALVPAKVPGMWLCPPGHQEVTSEPVELCESAVAVQLDAVVGGKGLRPELGELVVAWRRVDQGGDPFWVLGPTGVGSPFTEAARPSLVAASQAHRRQIESLVRRSLAQTQDDYWKVRHDIARRKAADPSFLPVDLPQGISEAEVVDFFLEQRRPADSLGGLTTDGAFLRRAYLDLVGVIPSEAEMEAFFAQPAAERRQWLVQRLLNDPRWADAWVPFWQDLLAENPGILKPELNNTGPFRFWIYESFLDNKPLDRFVTELVLMEGGKYEGGPAGFSMATQNDVPMAAKAHVLAQAFLAMDLSCARCHDSPLHPYRQQDLFGIAALLAGAPLEVPATSSVPAIVGGRVPAVEVSLRPGDRVEPHWPWASADNADISSAPAADSLRAQLAWQITAPSNVRFVKVFVNRVWHRYMGWALVPSLDDWQTEASAFPEVLNYLARDFMAHGYDVKHLVKRVVSSRAYQRQPVDTVDEAHRQCAPLRRRMSAEQILDSIYSAMEKTFGSEELTMDGEGRRPYDTFLNLGTPLRAWQLTGLANERDRPALALPVAQTLVDVLTAFGWREARPNPIGQRDTTPQLLQPLTLANGLAVHRAVRLSEDTPWVDRALQAATAEELLRRMFRATLTRDPTPDELTEIVPILQEGFATRSTGLPPAPPSYDRRLPLRVSWSNHLSPEATELKNQWEALVREGEPPTVRLQSAWRERCEDVFWALLNSPEFLFIP